MSVKTRLLFCIWAASWISVAGASGGQGTKEIPTPFAELNRKVELAQGESYLLNGWIRFIKDTYFLEVDLNDHPWLASAKRVASPYYLILNFPTARKDLKDARVSLKVQARGQIGYLDETSRMEYSIQLRLIESLEGQTTGNR